MTLAEVLDFAASLRGNASLRKLTLPFLRYTEDRLLEDTAMCARLLRACRTLHTLDLSNNSLNAAVYRALGPALRDLRGDVGLRVLNLHLVADEYPETVALAKHAARRGIAVTAED